VSFEFKVPDNQKSGFYAAKLQTANGSHYYASFWVRPKRGEPTAKIAFLVPLFSYLAYGVTGPTMFSNTALSQYSRYEDGGGVFYSSRLRPLSNMQSEATGTPQAPRMFGTPWQYEADTHIVD